MSYSSSNVRIHDELSYPAGANEAGSLGRQRDLHGPVLMPAIAKAARRRPVLARCARGPAHRAPGRRAAHDRVRDPSRGAGPAGSRAVLPTPRHIFAVAGSARSCSSDSVIVASPQRFGRRARRLEAGATASSAPPHAGDGAAAPTAAVAPESGGIARSFRSGMASPARQ